MRVAVAGFYCETNSFSDIHAPPVSLLTGEAVRAQHAGASSVLGGYLEYERRQPEFGLSILGLARVGPGGAVRDAALAAIIDPLLQQLARQPPPDGVLMALHGSAMTESRFDVDADFVAAVRRTVGPDTPIGVTLDAHANISPRLCEVADVVTVYKTTPHVDQLERGFATARLVDDAAAGRISPVVSLIKVPVLPGVLHHNTDLPPLRGIMEVARRMECRQGMLSLDVAIGTAFGDSPNLGMSVISISDGSPLPGDVAARELAGLIWEERAALTTAPDTIEEALSKLREGAQERALVIDLGDNVYGGASGRSADLFLAFAKAGFSDVVATIFAPVGAARAAHIGVGGQFTTCFPRGGARSGGVSAILTDPDGRPRAAVIEIENGNALILAAERELAGNLKHLLDSGIVPPRMRILLAKGDHRTAADLKRTVDDVVWVGTSGATTPQLSLLPYRKRARPLVPLDLIP